MNANFTEESCTGTGNVLTLTGPTTGNIGFAAAFQNGDSVRYSVYDADGVTKVAGIGVYSAGTITRNDTWSFDGVVDNSPASNITLSAGTHTVRCSLLASDGDKLDAIEPAATKGAGALGIAPASVSVDTTLTALSPGYQVVAVGTSGDINITLPDATTVTNSAIVYILENNGDGDLYVKNDSGSVIASVSAGQRIGMNLIDGTTADGVWASFGFSSGAPVTASNATFGAKTAFITASIEQGPYSITRITDNKVLQVFDSGGVASAMMLTITGNVITAGAINTVDVNSQFSFTNAVTRLTDTKAVVAWVEPSGQMVMMVLDIAGDVVTGNTKYNVSGLYNDYFSIARLTDTKAIVTFTDSDNSSQITSVVVDVAGSVCAFGPLVALNGAVSAYATSMVALSETKVLAGYHQQGGTEDARVQVLNISGNVITTGASYVVTGMEKSFDVRVDRLSSSKCLIAGANGNSLTGQCAVVDIVGDVCTNGTVFEYSSTRVSDVTMSVLNATTAIVSYKDLASTTFGESFVLDISGSTVTKRAMLTWHSDRVEDCVSIPLKTNQVLLAFEDRNNSSHATGLVFDLGAWDSF